MSCKIVNKELQIASVCLADLTLDLVQDILKQWGYGAKIGTLTLFYQSADGLLVLNQDNKDYEKYLILAETYISGNDEIRKKMRADFLETHYEELNVLEECVQGRAVKNNTPEEREVQ